MPSVEFFISHRSKEITDWIPIYEEVKELGYNIHTEPVECDISIVLNGKFVNLNLSILCRYEERRYYFIIQAIGSYINGKRCSNLF